MFRVNRFLSYTILISSATAIGPLVASFIVQYSIGGWVDYMWVCVALAGVNLAAIFFLYPESNFRRPGGSIHHVLKSGTQLVENPNEYEGIVRTENTFWHTVTIVQKPWKTVWKTFITVDHDVKLLGAFWQPFVMLSKPSILLAIYIYGTSLASQIILV